MHFATTALGCKTNGDLSFRGDGDVEQILFDASDASLKFTDNKKAKFGTGDDLKIYHDGSHSYIDSEVGSFYIRDTGGSERVRINGYGTAITGGLLFGTDTAAANALDDYEEGTFNASYYWSGSDANADGRYTKIGNRVFISVFEFAGGGQGLNDKDITYISGLPFSARTEPHSTGVIVRYSGGDHQTIGTGEFCYLAQGGTQIKFDDTFNTGTGNWTVSLVYEIA